MAEQLTLQIEPRRDVGSRAARRVRKQGRIPGIIYGRGTPEAISIDQADFRHRVKPEHYGSAVLQLQQGEADAGMAVVKSVHADVLHGDIISIDLQRVSSVERVHLTVPVVLHGEPFGQRTGGVLDQPLHLINVRCLVSDVPAQIDHDVSPLHVGDAVHAGQLALPPGVELLDPSDEVIAVVLAPTIPVDQEAVIVEPEVAGPELTEEKQKEDFPSDR